MPSHIEIPDHITARTITPPFEASYPSYPEQSLDKGKNPFGTFYGEAKQLAATDDYEGARQLCAEKTTEIAIETISHFEQAHTVEEGLRFYSYALTLANKGITMQWMKNVVPGGREGQDYDQSVPGQPHRGEEILWRTSEYILLRLHEKFGYSLQMALQIPNGVPDNTMTIPLHNPVPVDYDKLAEAFPLQENEMSPVERFSQGLAHDRSGGYHYRIETVSPSHKDDNGINRYCIDIVVPEQTPLQAPFNGKVVHLVTHNTEHGIGQQYGDKDNRILVEYARANGISITAALRHLAPYSSVSGSNALPRLQVGTKVKAGDALGHIGMTGWTTTSHLHLEIGAYREVSPGQFILLQTYPIVMLAS